MCQQQLHERAVAAPVDGRTERRAAWRAALRPGRIGPTLEQQLGDRAVPELHGDGQGAPPVCAPLPDRSWVVVQYRRDTVDVAKRGGDRQIADGAAREQEPCGREVAFRWSEVVPSPNREIDGLHVS